MLEVTEMRAWNFFGTYSLVLMYLGLDSLGTMLALAEPARLTGPAARLIPAGLESEAWGGHAENHEGFFAGLEAGEIATFGQSIEDREAMLPYIGILCGGDSP